MNAIYSVLRERLAGALQLLPDKPEETVDSTLRALWHTAAGDPKSAVSAMREALPTLDAGGAPAQMLETLVESRLAGTPLSHLTGREHFMEMELLAGPQALIPRKETELLAHAAIDLLRQAAAPRSALKVVDVCTGSGNIALAVAHHVRDVHVVGSDFSADAIELARRNAACLDLSGRVQFHVGDFMAPLETLEFLGNTDLLICNPPYIGSGKVERMAEEIATHEPRLAFDGGALGVRLLMRLLEDAPRFLRSNGWLAFEVGLDQGPALLRRMQRSGDYAEIRALENAAGAVRAIVARRQ